MRRMMRAAATLLLLLLCGAWVLPTFAATSTTTYTLSQQQDTISMTQSNGELAFWEAPDVTTGQSRRGGVIAFENQTEYVTDFVFDHVTLPYDDEAALAYLDAVTVDISEGETTYYHDTFTHLMDGGLAGLKLADVPAGGRRELSVSISCSYTYAGQVPAYSSLVWTFRPLVHQETVTTPAPTEPTEQAVTINWTLIWLLVGGVVAAVALGVIIAVCVWLVRRHRRMH